jgi:hypothetical protein
VRAGSAEDATTRPEYNSECRHDVGRKADEISGLVAVDDGRVVSLHDGRPVSLNQGVYALVDAYNQLAYQRLRITRPNGAIA